MLIFIIWIICILIATHLGVKKGYPFLGFFNGLILGPLGIFIVMIQDNKHRHPCPSCAEQILKKATLCPHCGNKASQP
ncbi:MAG: hypothetical protein RPT11_03000 [Bermanella sp.]